MGPLLLTDEGRRYDFFSQILLFYVYNRLRITVLIDYYSLGISMQLFRLQDNLTEGG